MNLLQSYLFFIPGMCGVVFRLNITTGPMLYVLHYSPTVIGCIRHVILHQDHSQCCKCTHILESSKGVFIESRGETENLPNVVYITQKTVRVQN